jgi:hypothetical protein
MMCVRRRARHDPSQQPRQIKTPAGEPGQQQGEYRYIYRVPDAGYRIGDTWQNIKK